MKIRNKLLTGLILLTGCTLFSVSVFAFWKTVDIADNVVTLGAYRTELVEEYDPPDSVYPGMSVDKKINVKNSGTVDAIIRIRFEKVFGTRLSDGVFRPETDLDSTMIQIECNENLWKQKDGYWYYTEVLKAGEQTREALFDSFSISKQADNQYKGKAAEIIVYLDSVQAEANALSLWGITAEELNIQYEPNDSKQTTAVTFHGKEKGFTFTGTESDLFANFKNLVPGGSRSQNIQIQNNSNENIKLYLYAEIAEQDHMSKEKLQALEQILKHDAQIVIRLNNTILYQGPVNGNPDLKSNSMGEHARILLGTYPADSKKELQVDLSLAPEWKESSENLIGHVNWVFCAEEDSSDKSSSVTGYVPKTGDSTPWMIPAAVGTVSFSLFCFLGFKCLKRNICRKSTGKSGKKQYEKQHETYHS